jgi:Short C-terminal domain
MRKLTTQGERAVAELSSRYGVSPDAVRVLLEAVRLGNGTMAQFSHPELGGPGQWMAGGMTMVGAMSDHGLQATVSGLAGELSALLASTPVYAPTAGPVTATGAALADQANRASWWPGELGPPGSSGSQDNARYAVFPQARRLAVQSGGGPVRVYDTLGHVIGGVQQGGSLGPLSFTSQHGTFTVESLPLASPGQPAPPGEPAPPAAPAEGATPAAEAVLTALGRLGDLHQRGILTDAEFAAKKAELLSRL